MNLRKLYESGKLLSFAEAQKDLELIGHAQQNLIRLGLLEPPADGRMGPISMAAIATFQASLKITEVGIGKQTCKALIEVLDMPNMAPLHLDSGFAGQLVRYFRARGWYFSQNPQEINICYVEGADIDGKPNSDAPNEWNDRRIIWQVTAGGAPLIVGNWPASCEPGWWYTLNPLNAEGCARIKNPAQYKAWRVGTHGGSKPHQALVQVAPVEVFRDRDKDMMRTGDKLFQGLYGINQHWGYGMQHVDRASAGCSVAPDWNGHVEFMAKCKGDRRYKLNNAYDFWTAFIPGDKLWSVA